MPIRKKIKLNETIIPVICGSSLVRANISIKVNKSGIIIGMINIPSNSKNILMTIKLYPTFFSYRITFAFLY